MSNYQKLLKNIEEKDNRLREIDEYLNTQMITRSKIKHYQQLRKDLSNDVIMDKLLLSTMEPEWCSAEIIVKNPLENSTNFEKKEDNCEKKENLNGIGSIWSTEFVKPSYLFDEKWD